MFLNMMGFVGLQGYGLVSAQKARTNVCGRSRRRVVLAEVDVTNFPSEPTKDAVDLGKTPEEYVELKKVLRGTPLFLVGMMGSGKTSVGKILAEQIGYNYLDTDTIIQELMKMPITDIFEKHGEEGFRQVEAAVVQQVSAYVRTVVSTGGGVVLNQQNWGHLQSGLVIWLDVSAEEILKRVKDDKTRPLLQVDDPKARLEHLIQERETQYAQADVRIVVEPEEGIEEVAFNAARGAIRFIELHPPKSAAYRPLENK